MLTGLSFPKFNDAVQSMHTIEDIFRQQAVLDGNMEVWVQSAFQGHPSIDVGNQYFTPHQHALQDRQISFSTAIDPTTYSLRRWERSLSILKTTKLNIMKPVRKQGEPSESWTTDVTK